MDHLLRLNGGVFLCPWNRVHLTDHNFYSEAMKKTGKYVQSILEQLERALGVHALVLVTYQDESGDVKISECVHATCGLTQLKPNTCKVSNHRRYQQRIILKPCTVVR